MPIDGHRSKQPNLDTSHLSRSVSEVRCYLGQMDNYIKLLQNREGVFRERSITGGALTKGFYDHLTKQTVTFQEMAHR